MNPTYRRNVRLLMGHQNMTQKELGQLVDRSRGWVSDLLTGKILSTTEKRCDVATALGLDDDTPLYWYGATLTELLKGD